MQPMLNIAVRAARAGGDQIIRHVNRVHTLHVEHKARNDFVSEVDRLAEREIIAVIRKAYPDHAILAEESGASAGNEFEWIIDPLDGTTNFLHGFPQFAVSIALRRKQQLEYGVIYDPMRQELFTAARGGGAFLDNRRLRVSETRHLRDALLGTGFPFRAIQNVDAYLGLLKIFMTTSAGIRRPGSAALDLAYVAAGRFDGFWESHLSTWDIAAGVLLVREAGGMVTDLTGDDGFMDSGHIVAANRHVITEMLKEIRPFARALQAEMEDPG